MSRPVLHKADGVVYAHGYRKPAHPCGECPAREWPGVLWRKINIGAGIAWRRQRPLLFVGEAPGIEEIEKGENFIGQAGRLYSLLRRLACIDGHYHVTVNAARCSLGSGPGQKPPAQAFIHCEALLQKDLVELDPPVIVPMGTRAVRSLAKIIPAFKKKVGPKWTLTDLDGVPFDVDGVLITPVFHPAFFLKPGRAFQLPFAYNTWENLGRRWRRVLGGGGLR